MPGLTSNPRIAGGNAGITSLGAVGGPRGGAAAGARIIVDFITNYDASAVKQLQADLASFTNTIATEEARRTRIVQRNINARGRYERGEAIARAKIALAPADAQRQLKKDLADAKALAESPRRVDRQKAEQKIEQIITGLRTSAVNLSKEDERILRRMLVSRRTMVSTGRQLHTIQSRITAATHEQAAAQQKLLTLQRAGALASRFGALAIGMAGGLVGGLVLGAAFTAIEGALGQVGETLLNVIDPLRTARAEFKALGEEIRGMEGEGVITDADRVKAWAEQYGISLTDAEKSTLAYAAALDRYVESYNKKKQAEEAAKGNNDELSKINRDLANSLIEQDREAKKLVTTYGQSGTTMGIVVDQEYYLKKAAELTNQTLAAQANALYAQADAARRSAQATAFAAIAQQQFQNAADAAMGRQSASYDARVEALGSGESARTRGLQARLDRAQGGGGSGNAQALRDNAEERALTLLRMRLRLLGTAINIEKYEGKFRLEAINMRIKALQEEGDAQDRVNRLLQNQYEQSQEVRRNEGESIKDYLERRAQKNRELLSEADDIRRDEQQAALDKQKDIVEDEIKLRELAEQRKQMLQSAGTSAYIENLQKQLKASQEADAKALEAKKKAIEEAKKAQEAANKEAIELSTEAATQQALAAVKGIRFVEQWNKVSGYLSGLYRARSALEALVKGFGLPPDMARGYLANLDKQIAAWEAKQSEFLGGVTVDGKTRLAGGGIVMLKNSQNPFGSNVRVGEGGSELAVVLSNKVTNALSRTKSGSQNFGPFVLQSSGDLLRDRYGLKKLVSEAVGEALQ